MNPGLADSNFAASRLAVALMERAKRDKIWTEMNWAKGQLFFEQGEEIKHVFLLRSGLVKLVYATPGGDHWIKSLIVDEGIFGASSPDSEGPVTYSAHAIEPSQAGLLPVAWIRSVLDKDSEMRWLYSGFADWLRLRKEAREADLLCKSAEERYRDLRANQASLLCRLPQGDIARFLRVTPIAFSRIKRRID